MKHTRLRGAYLYLSGVTFRAAEVFDNFNTSIVGEYNTACFDALASRSIYSSSPTSRNDLSRGGGRRESSRSDRDRDKNGSLSVSPLQAQPFL